MTSPNIVDSDEEGDLELRDAVRLAQRDSKFAAAFLQSPATFKDMFGLSPADVEIVQDAGSLEDLVGTLERGKP